MSDPTYDIVKDIALGPNAFVEPNNPLAVFPQHAKPHIIDFRSHKMAQCGFASRFNFRKTMSNRAKEPKYKTTVTTIEEIEASAAQLA